MKVLPKKSGKGSHAICGLLGLVLLVPFLSGAGDEGRSTLEANRKKIETMSEDEREKLLRNHGEFEKLSRDEQRVLRELHQRVEADSRKGGNLQDVMLVYKEWLKTLSPWQREKLLKEKKPSARLELVRQFKEGQETEEWMQSLSGERRGVLSGMLRAVSDEGKRKELIQKFKQEQETRPPQTQFSFRRHHRPSIPVDEFDRVMTLVETKTHFSTRHQDLLKSPGITKSERNLIILISALKQSHPSKFFLPGPRPGEQPGPRPMNEPVVNWPDDQLMDQIVNSISDPDFQKRYREHEGDGGQKRYVFSKIVGSFFAERMKEFRGVNPGSEDLRKFFLGLDQEKKDELLRHSRSEQSRRLKFLYYITEMGRRLTQAGLYEEMQELLGFMGRFNRGRRGSFSRDGREGPDGRRGKGFRPGEGRGRPGEGPFRGRDGEKFDPEKRPPRFPGKDRPRKGPPPRREEGAKERGKV